MPASPHSSDCERATSWRAADVRARLLIAAAVGCALISCATVRPEDRERLADPSMRFDAASMAERHEQHVADNREGSTGGGSAKGGGCGCN